MMKHIACAATAFVFVVAAARADAQSSNAQPIDHPRRLGAIVSGTFGDGGPTPAVSVTGGYRLRPWLAIEADVSHTPSLDFGEYSSCPPDAICLAVIGVPFKLQGRATSVALNAVVDVPVRSRWIRPYVAAGAGLAHLRRELHYQLYFPDQKISSNDALLSFGGGADFPVGHRVSLGVDLRYQRIFGTTESGVLDRRDIARNLDMTRLGSSVSYRF